jgi:hypothetical protein
VARLDVPTSDDPAVMSQISALFPRPPHTVSWAVILTCVDTVSAVLRVLSQTVVLFGVLRDQKDGLLFAFLAFASNMASYLSFATTWRLSGSKSAFVLFAFG